MDFWRNEWNKVTDTSELLGVSKMENSDDDEIKKGSEIAQKLNSFASTFRNVLSRMYRKSTYTGNTQEDIDNGIPLKEVKEFVHHIIKTKEGSYREFEENGEYYDFPRCRTNPFVNSELNYRRKKHNKEIGFSRPFCK